MIGRWHGLIINCPEPEALANFYQELLGMVRVQGYDEASIVIGDAPDRPGSGLREGRGLPAAHLARNDVPQQLHFDVRVDDLDEAEPKVLALGARRLEGGGDAYRVFADPAGHPFCLVIYRLGRARESGAGRSPRRLHDFVGGHSVEAAPPMLKIEPQTAIVMMMPSANAAMPRIRPVVATPLLRRKALVRVGNADGAEDDRQNAHDPAEAGHAGDPAGDETDDAEDQRGGAHAVLGLPHHHGRTVGRRVSGGLGRQLRRRGVRLRRGCDGWP